MLVRRRVNSAADVAFLEKYILMLASIAVISIQLAD